MTKLRTVAQSLSAEARGMTRKMPGVHVALLVYDATDTALVVVHDDQQVNWDAIAARFKGTAEELRAQIRSPK